MINTGTLDVDWSQPVSSKLRNDGQSSCDFDWSQPLSTKLSGQSSSDFDWSQPVSSKLDNGETSSSFDWSQPVSNTPSGYEQTNDKLNGIDSPSSGFKDKETSSGLDWSQPVSAVLGGTGLQDTSIRAEYNGPSTVDEGFMDTSNEINDSNAVEKSGEVANSSESQNNDAIAQRLKFRACLKLVVEELCTLPHHCEIHNKDLRSTFTAWLKKELDLIHRICDFKRDGTKTKSLLPLRMSTPTPLETGKVSFKPLFHSSQKPIRKLAASSFTYCDWMKVLAASLRVGFCDKWKRAFKPTCGN